MNKSKKLIVLILSFMMLIGGTLPVGAATKAMPYTTTCPNCQHSSGVKNVTTACKYCKKEASWYHCEYCNNNYVRCISGHCYE